MISGACYLMALVANFAFRVLLVFDWLKNVDVNCYKYLSNVPLQLKMCFETGVFIILCTHVWIIYVYACYVYVYICIIQALIMYVYVYGCIIYTYIPTHTHYICTCMYYVYAYI